MKTVIIDYKAGNIRSVSFALERLGVTPILSGDPETIRSADHVIFPGVGEASSAMKHLKEAGLEKVIPSLTQPVLGVCLGMQLMCRHSEENDTDCLGIFPYEVKLFPPKAKVPHMGWNNITNLRTSLFSGVKEGAYMYFVHSYFVELGPDTAAACNYIVPFSAALQARNFYAAQFHPEKSADEGQAIYANFLKIKS